MKHKHTRKSLQFSRSTSWMVACTLGIVLATSTAWGAAWKRTGAEEGVELFERDADDAAKGEQVVEFRGVMTFNANIRELVAVMYAYPQRFRWMRLMETHELLERRSSTERVFYSRFKSPFFMVSDRDVNTVIKSRFFPKKQTITTEFWDVDVPSHPPGEDAVRISVMKGKWVLKALGPDTTWASYELRTDPGGWIPDWVARRVTRSLPSYTLRTLGAQVGNPVYEPSRQEVRYIFNWQGYPEPGPQTAQIQPKQPPQE